MLPGDWDLAHAIRLGIKPFAELGANLEALSGSQVDSPCSCRAIFESAPVALLSDPLFRVFRWIPWLISDPPGAAIGCCWTESAVRICADLGCRGNRVSAELSGPVPQTQKRPERHWDLPWLRIRVARARFLIHVKSTNGNAAPERRIATGKQTSRSKIFYDLQPHA